MPYGVRPTVICHQLPHGNGSTARQYAALLSVEDIPQPELSPAYVAHHGHDAQAFHLRRLLFRQRPVVHLPYEVVVVVHHQHEGLSVSRLGVWSAYGESQHALCYE